METNGRIWPNFELIQAFMHVLIVCKYEKDQVKNSGRKCDDIIFSILVYGIFFQTLKGSQLRDTWTTPNFELIQALMYIIVTCKYEMNPIKKRSRKCVDADSSKAVALLKFSVVCFKLMLRHPSSSLFVVSNVESSSPLKLLGQSKPNFMRRFLGKGERK